MEPNPKPHLYKAEAALEGNVLKDLCINFCRMLTTITCHKWGLLNLTFIIVSVFNFKVKVECRKMASETFLEVFSVIPQGR